MLIFKILDFTSIMNFNIVCVCWCRITVQDYKIWQQDKANSKGALDDSLVLRCVCVCCHSLKYLRLWMCVSTLPRVLSRIYNIYIFDMLVVCIVVSIPQRVLPSQATRNIVWHPLCHIATSLYKGVETDVHLYICGVSPNPPQDARAALRRVHRRNEDDVDARMKMATRANMINDYYTTEHHTINPRSPPRARFSIRSPHHWGRLHHQLCSILSILCYIYVIW